MLFRRIDVPKDNSVRTSGVVDQNGNCGSRSRDIEVHWLSRTRKVQASWLRRRRQDTNLVHVKDAGPESPATWPRNPTEQTSRHNAGSKFLRNDMCFSPGIVPFGCAYQVLGLGRAWGGESPHEKDAACGAATTSRRLQRGIERAFELISYALSKNLDAVDGQPY